VLDVELHTGSGGRTMCAEQQFFALGFKESTQHLE